MTEPGTPSTSRLRSLIRRLRPIHAAPLLMVLVLACWAYASPIGAAPDDDFHLTSTWCANLDRAELCQDGTEPGERVVPPAVLFAPCFAQDPEVSAACITSYLEQSPDPSVRTHRGNFEGNYPPLYYSFMNLFASQDLQVSALAMRWVNIAIFVLFSTGLFLLLPRLLRPPLVLGWLITTVPLGLFLIPSNNPSSWAVMGVGFAWLALLGYVRSTGARRVGLGALFVIAVLLACARGDSALYTLVGVGAVAVLVFTPSKRFWLDAILPAVTLVLPIIFFLTSQQSGVASHGLSHSGAPASESGIAGLGLIAYNLLMVPSLWAGIFGGWGLGWIDTPMPAVVIYGGLAVFIGIAFVGIRSAGVRKTIVLCLVGLVLWLLPVYVLQQGGSAVGENVQPRYLLPLIVLFAGLLVLAMHREPEITFGRIQLAFVGGALAISQSFALHFNLRRYVTGTDVRTPDLNAGAEWWWNGLPLSPMALWVLGSAAFAVLLFVLLRDYRASRTQLVTSQEVADVQRR